MQLNVVTGHTFSDINGTSKQDYGDHICSVAEIVPEIRDEASRNRLLCLPYKLDFRQPDSASMKTGKHFDLIFACISSIRCEPLARQCMHYVSCDGCLTAHVNFCFR